MIADKVIVEPFVSHNKATAFKEPCELVETSNVLSLTRQSSATGSRLLRSVRSGDVSVQGTYGTSEISTASEGQVRLYPTRTP